MKDKSNKKCSPLGIKNIIVFVVLNLAFIFIATLFFVDYSKCVKVQKAIDGGVIVEAEIVYLDRTSATPHGSGHSYQIMCRYVDENGIIYECPCGSGTSSNPEQEKKDEQRIGEKVEIYIGEKLYGNKGACRAVNYGKEVKAWTQLAWGLTFISLTIVMFLLLTLYLLWFYNKFPFKKAVIKTEVDNKKINIT